MIVNVKWNQYNSLVFILCYFWCLFFFLFYFILSFNWCYFFCVHHKCVFWFRRFEYLCSNWDKISKTKFFTFIGSCWFQSFEIFVAWIFYLSFFLKHMPVLYFGFRMICHLFCFDFVFLLVVYNLYFSNQIKLSIGMMINKKE